MNRREFVRAALLAGAGAACGVRAASPAPEVSNFAAVVAGERIFFEGLARDMGPVLDEMRQNMCDALDEEWATGRWG